MKFLYYIFINGLWFECEYDLYLKHYGKKYKSPFNVLDDLNNGKIKVEEPKKKQYYASGMSLVNGKWQSCGWTIEANSFVEAAKIAEADKNFRIHSLKDGVMY